jgi:orotate phosphoribosyltransferase
VNYRSITDLNRAVQQWAGQLPQNIALVVGVPRSGFLAAMLLSLHRNLPVTDLDRFLEGRTLSIGARGSAAFREFTMYQDGVVLVVDDSVCTGSAIQQVKAKIAAAGLSSHVQYGALYVTDESKTLVDYWHEVVRMPRVFEWNLMHHPWVLSNSCVDLDGVLCRHPSEQENDDGAFYEHFLTTVPPLIVPSCEIAWLVTCRLEKYRSLTEQWLQDNRIKYKRLLMRDFPDKASRQAAGDHAAFKALHYSTTKVSLFVESSLPQAVEIARLSGKPVYCIGTRQMIEPGMVAQGIHQPKLLIRSALQSLAPGRWVLRAYDRAFNKGM